MSPKSLAALHFQQPQIRVGDRADLDHAGLSEQDRMWQLDFPAHAGSFGTAKVSQMRIKTGSCMDACVTHDVAFLYAPLDLAALVLRCLWLAVGDRTRARIRLACTDIRGPDRDSKGAVAGSGKAHVCTKAGVRTICPAVDKIVVSMTELSIMVAPVAAEQRIAKV